MCDISSDTNKTMTEWKCTTKVTLGNERKWSVYKGDLISKTNSLCYTVTQISVSWWF